MDINSDIKYSYSGIPLSPKICMEIIKNIFNGKIDSRKNIIHETCKYHKNNGGILNKTTPIPTIKKALFNLKKAGIANNISPRYWEIKSQISQNELPKLIEQPISIDKKQNTLWDMSLAAEKIIGHGEYAIYLYYFPTYKNFSEQQNKNIWFCKIGKTESDPVFRVLSQSSTALPELPIIALIIKTNYPSELEKIIHNILSMKGRKGIESPGNEWFITSPLEIEDIAIKILKF